MGEKADLLKLVPRPPDWTIPWEKWRATAFGPLFAQLEKTPQDALWHGEGDVWTHTRMTCEALTGLPRFRALDEERCAAVFLAALLHDAGKPRTTRPEDGRLTSPRHAAVGAAMVRELLWLEYGWCGQPRWQELRETVCALIRRHTLPPHAAFEENGPRQLLRAASAGALLPGFSVELLCLLAEADVLGRRAADRQQQLEAVQLCGVLAEELGCLTGPGPFPSGRALYAYCSGAQAEPFYDPYDDAWGEVVLLSGLPGTGKDTWIAAHCPDLPVVSLDAIRKELDVSPEEPQSRVADEARSRARALLRARQPFVWNATSVSPSLRRKQIDLFSGYRARVRVVYLETGWEEQLRRNRGRAAAVPEAVICRMLGKLTPPERWEAHRVDWFCL